MKQKAIDISGVAEAAKILEIQKKNISHARKTKDFPEPFVVLECGPIWMTSDLVDYKEKRDLKKSKRDGE